MKNRHLLLFISLVLVTLLGLAFKFYRGFGQEWLNNNGAAIWYEVFWCLFFFWFFPTKKAMILIPIWVFVVTCILEILQLWRSPILQMIRTTLIGRLLLGTTFSWLDFPHYAVGSLIGWLWLHQIYINSYKK
ncbi:MAG: DUF2809 domain-containing protein [Hydrococcus sp. Prado102]|jgi:hypothetical protein|nr:DUF2809 domain-containing protein [Hydrococcus sp. Prado102]